MKTLVSLLVVLLLNVGVPAQAQQPQRLHHQWPVVPGVVTRGFLQPAFDWLPGHRGVDLAADASSTASASAAGVVIFAGPVAGTLWVTVTHADGVVTSVGPLGLLFVGRGDVVHAGQGLGQVAPRADHDGLHWSARRDGEYIDPVTLLAGRVVPRLVGPGGWRPTGRRDLPAYDPWDGRDRTLGLLPSTQEAISPGWLTAPNPNHVVAVAGLLTTTGSTPLPVSHLGFPPEAITELSHRGRIELGTPGPDDPRRDQLPYESADTFLGVDRAARLLGEQLRAQWAREPGVAVDLVGHSLGGVIVMHYLLAHHDPADPTLPPIAHVVTLAAPLEGADGASAAASNNGGTGILAGLADLAGLILGVGTAPATLDDLTVGSPLLNDLADSWARAQADPHRSPLASGTQVLTIGGSRDLVVPEHRSDLPGAGHVTVPGGHAAMHETEAVLQVVRAFLAGQRVPAAPGGWGAWLSGGVSLAEQLVGIAG